MVAKGHVIVNRQTVYVLIPFVDLWATYRIQKLRLYLLIFLLGFLPAQVIWEISILGVDEYFGEDFDIGYSYTDPALLPGTIILTVVGRVLAMYLIRNWSHKWNKKFETEN